MSMLAMRVTNFTMARPYVPIGALRMYAYVIALIVLITQACIWSYAASRIDISGPAGSGTFGARVTALPNGNIVVTDPLYDAPGPIADVGAVYLYSGADGSLISTITGSTANDRIGGFVQVMPNGYYAILSWQWNGSRGAITFGNPTTGISGIVSPLNSMTGSTPNDTVGIRGVLALANGNYVFESNLWDNGAAVNAGAVTFCNLPTGCAGVVSPANSLVGTQTNDEVGKGLSIALPSGNYLALSGRWQNGAATQAGAVTLCSGTAGCVGALSPSNSLVGGSSGDLIGDTANSGGVSVLSNGNFLVLSPRFNSSGINDTGAITICSEAAGCTGLVSAANSLVGSTNGDRIGEGLNSITKLPGGKYVVSSPTWDNGPAVNAGAVTHCNAGGCTGTISPANSLVGGGGGSITLLTNGNYVVSGQVTTWCSGETGCTGAISPANSLIGFGSVVALPNGNYIVRNPNWANGSVLNAGAVTWCSGSSGCSGVVSAANSLVGSSLDDQVGGFGVIVLANGNYVVASPLWDPAGAVNSIGAVTWCSGSAGCVGPVSAANSLVGSATFPRSGNSVRALSNGNYVSGNSTLGTGTLAGITFCNGSTGTTGTISAANTLVGWGGPLELTNGNYVIAGRTNDGLPAVKWCPGPAGCPPGPISSGEALLTGNSDFMIRPLPNGNYVVINRFWNNGVIGSAGAVTLGNGQTGTTGPVSAANSLVGSSAFDSVGNNEIDILPTGDFLVRSSSWRNGTANSAGAVTWCSATLGCSGTVSPANSIVGSTSGDQIGSVPPTILPNGNYILKSANWNNGAIADAGAITYGAGKGTTAGTINANNSVLGSVANLGSSLTFALDPVNETIVVGPPSSNTVSLFKPTYTAITDGNWSAGATWDYGAFTKRHDVYVPNGRTVNLDVTDEVNSLRIDCSGSLSGFGASSYTIGSIRKDYCSPATFTYPSGTTNGYSPVTANVTALNFANGPGGSLSVAANDGTAPSNPPLPNATTLNRYWQLTETGSLTADLTFSYLQSDVDGGEAYYAMIRSSAGGPPLGFPNASPCPGIGRPCVDTTANSIFVAAVESFDNFWTAGSLAPTAAVVSVSGRVATANGNGIRSVRLTLTAPNGAIRSAITSAFGYYAFDDVEVGQTYVLEVAAKKFTFTSPTRVFSLQDEITDMDFTADPQ